MRKWNDALGKDLDWIVAQCLQKDPSGRPTAEALLSALGQIRKKLE